MDDSLKLETSDALRAQVNQAMPGDFDFYNLGKVTPSPLESVESIEDFAENCVGVAFSIYPMKDAEGSTAALRTLMLAVFEDGLDPDVYSEVGNIIASRFAGGLSRMLSEDIMITPPLLLKPAAVQRLTRLKRQTLSHRRYFHSFDSKLIPIDVLVLRVEGEKKGHA